MTFNEGGSCIEEQKRWYADGAEDNLRFAVPLTDESTVLGIGGYEGWWSEELLAHCGCNPRIFIFEPVEEFYVRACRRFRGSPIVAVYNLGLGSEFKKVTFGKNVYGSGQFSNGEKVEVEIRDVIRALDDLKLWEITLASINIEGGEYDLFARLIGANALRRFENIQVQFHNLMPTAIQYRDRIREELAKTHNERYNYSFCWEAWVRKPECAVQS